MDPGYTEPQYVCWQQGHDDTPCNVGDTFYSRCFNRSYWYNWTSIW